MKTFFFHLHRNLQAAICSYYDFDQPSVKSPQLAFVGDVTIGDGEAVPPNTTFTKTWRVANSGGFFCFCYLTLYFIDTHFNASTTDSF